VIEIVGEAEDAAGSAHSAVPLDARNSRLDRAENETRRDIMGHLGSFSIDALRSRRTSRKSCEKASRRLRSLIAKANRWGLTADEVVELPATKRLLPGRATSTSATWTTLAAIALILGAGIVLLLYICAPCISRTT